MHAEKAKLEIKISFAEKNRIPHRPCDARKTKEIRDNKRKKRKREIGMTTTSHQPGFYPQNTFLLPTPKMRNSVNHIRSRRV